MHLVTKIENHADEMAHLRTLHTDGAETILVSYGSSARSARHLVQSRRARGEPVGLIELQTLWPFPGEQVRRLCGEADYVLVVEMNMGQVLREVRRVVSRPERVFLANRYDGELIGPNDISNIMRLVQGRGV